MPQTATGTRQVLSLDDLPGWRHSGAWIRARCPIHGSDHQRSLSVRDDDSEYRGFGDCKACGAQVIIRELNPDAAARFESGRAGPGRERSARDYRQQFARATLQHHATAPAPDVPEWQRDELMALQKLYPRMQERLSDARAVAYLTERGVPLDIAQGLGIGYIPADAKLAGTALAAKWRDRIIFPLGSPAGSGFIGRSLHGWQPGMDETEHKHLLDAKDRDPEDLKAWGRRWEKTNPAGWFLYENLAVGGSVVIVEGGFDALALVAAGFSGNELVALAGVAASEDWIPSNLQDVLLALDGDETGQAKALSLAAQIGHAYPWPRVRVCTPPADGLGKDWSERWRQAEWDGVAAVFDALAEIEQGMEHPVEDLPPSPTPMVAIDPEPVPAATNEANGVPPVVDDLEALARADDIVSMLLGAGFVLAEVREVAEDEPRPPARLQEDEAVRVLDWPELPTDVPPSEPCTCGKRLWAHRQDGQGWACFACDHALCVVGHAGKVAS